MSDQRQLTADIVEYSATRLEDSVLQINKCLNLLSVEQIWHRPNEVSNAIGNLVIHLNGDLRQWILTSLDGLPDDRDRPAEFAQQGPLPTNDIINQLQETVRKTCEVIRGLSSEQLLAHVTVQGYDVSGTAAVIHVVEHFSLHTGQIVYATKILSGQDLSLYDAQGQRVDGRAQGTP